MENVLIVFNAPSDLGMGEELTDELIREKCFKVMRFDNGSEALWTYANLPCTWSHLVDEDTDTDKWCDEAFEHIKSHDYDWLEENFE